MPGLRREELAQAAALSVDYYVRLEQGRLRNPSAEVVDAVATALALDPAERRYLHNLARPPGTTEPDEPAAVRPTIQLVLDNLAVPGVVYDRYARILAWNRLAAALLVDFGELAPEERSMPRLLFLDDELASRFVEWERKARDLVSQLRLETSRTPDDETLTTLVSDLSARSPAFAKLWASRRVHQKTGGDHGYRHPVVGEFTLRYEVFSPPDTPGISLVCHVAEPGTPDEEALRLLASWTEETGRLDRVNMQLR